MARRIVLIQGHPDVSGNHYCHALAEAYAKAALAAGHAVRRIDVAALNFPWLRSKVEWESAGPPEVLEQAAGDLLWAEHVVLFFPLWLGTVPAVLKAFFEQVLRPDGRSGAESLRGRLANRSVRVVVTMGMPALFYRLYFASHGVKGFTRGVLAFVGMGPIRISYIGLVERSAVARARWLVRLGHLGSRAR